MENYCCRLKYIVYLYDYSKVTTPQTAFHFWKQILMFGTFFCNMKDFFKKLIP